MQYFAALCTLKSKWLKKNSPVPFYTVYLPIFIRLILLDGNTYIITYTHIFKCFQITIKLITKQSHSHLLILREALINTQDF